MAAREFINVLFFLRKFGKRKTVKEAKKTLNSRSAAHNIK
jgi:hypothetical protein